MNSAQAAYQETQILTATPQKLRLMLIEAAIRTAARGQDALREQRFDDALEILNRSRDIIAELLSGIRPGAHPLNDMARALYAFVFKSLAEAQLFRNPTKVDDALRVLHEERETWLQVCEVCPEAPTLSELDGYRGQEVVASELDSSDLPGPRERFSLDA